MESTPLAEAKAELEKLLLRKAKAESLDAENLDKYRHEYDRICTRIRLLQNVVAAYSDGPAKQMLELLREIMKMTWKPGYIENAILLERDFEHKQKQFEFEIASAYEQSDRLRAMTAIAGYAEMLRRVNRILNEQDGKQYILTFEPTNEATPFDNDTEGS